MLPIETIAKSTSSSNCARSLLKYRPPQDYPWPENDFERFTFECGHAQTPYIRDLTSEGCFIDIEQGRE